MSRIASFLALTGSLACSLACSHEAPPPAESPSVTPEGTASVSAPSEAPAPSASTAEPSAAEAPTELTAEECQAKSGVLITDKGDGSLQREGCPGGREKLGSVRVGIEGGLCCAASGPPGPAGKRAPCTLGQDQTCNADPTVSALWGKCLPTGTCECKPGFVLAPTGYCQPAK